MAPQTGVFGGTPSKLLVFRAVLIKPCKGPGPRTGDGKQLTVNGYVGSS